MRPVSATRDALPGFAVEPTAIGPQSLVPGVTPITSRDRLAWRAAAPLEPKKPQRACDHGLFDLNARLTADDRCLFLFEYTSGQGYAFSSTNNLISNLKKKPGANGRGYKNSAISQCASYLRGTLSGEWLANATLVPVPPLKAVGDPLYDNRMERICRLIRPDLDVRLLVRQVASTAAAHEVAAGERPSVHDLLEIYEIDETKSQPTPSVIGIFDDVLTAGTHYRAMKIILSERFPGIPIFGIFIARRIFATLDCDDH